MHNSGITGATGWLLRSVCKILPRKNLGAYLFQNIRKFQRSAFIETFDSAETGAESQPIRPDARARTCTRIHAQHMQTHTHFRNTVEELAGCYAQHEAPANRCVDWFVMIDAAPHHKCRTSLLANRATLVRAPCLKWKPGSARLRQTHKRNKRERAVVGPAPKNERTNSSIAKRRHKSDLLSRTTEPHNITRRDCSFGDGYSPDCGPAGRETGRAGLKKASEAFSR